jgi:hypothetical protein
MDFRQNKENILSSFKRKLMIKLNAMSDLMVDLRFHDFWSMVLILNKYIYRKQNKWLASLLNVGYIYYLTNDIQKIPLPIFFFL